MELIDEHNHHVMGAEKGSRKLRKLLEGNQNEESVIEIDQQPLY